MRYTATDLTWDVSVLHELIYSETTSCRRGKRTPGAKRTSPRFKLAVRDTRGVGVTFGRWLDPHCAHGKEGAKAINTMASLLCPALPCYIVLSEQSRRSSRARTEAEREQQPIGPQAHSANTTWLVVYILHKAATARKPLVASRAWSVLCSLVEHAVVNGGGVHFSVEGKALGLHVCRSHFLQRAGVCQHKSRLTFFCLNAFIVPKPAGHSKVNLVLTEPTRDLLESCCQEVWEDGCRYSHTHTEARTSTDTRTHPDTQTDT